MEILTLFFLAIVLLKMTGIVLAFRWLWTEGERYSEALRSDPGRTTEHYHAALEQAGGSTFPFGLKDYRLRRYIAVRVEAKGSERVGFWIASAFLAIYRYERLIYLVGIWTVASAGLGNRSMLFTSLHTHGLLLYVLATAALGSNILMSIEAVISYATLGGYATHVHMHSQKRRNALLLELRVIITRLVTTIVAGTAAAFVAQVAFAAFDGKPLVSTPTADLASVMTTLFQMIYWTMTTFTTVGFGDISPANGFGQLVAMLLEVQAFAVVALVFSSLFASNHPTAP